jgi:hypothetical protein
MGVAVFYFPNPSILNAKPLRTVLSVVPVTASNLAAAPEANFALAFPPIQRVVCMA